MSSLTQKALQANSRRLLSLPYPPPADARFVWAQEFDRIAKKFCESDEHLIQVTDRLMESQYGNPPQSRCPAPADMVRACQATRLPNKAPAGCSSCSDGFVQLSKIVNGVSYDVAAYCGCEKGAWLKERQRK